MTRTKIFSTIAMIAIAGCVADPVDDVQPGPATEPGIEVTATDVETEPLNQLAHIRRQEQENRRAELANVNDAVASTAANRAAEPHFSVQKHALRRRSEADISYAVQESARMVAPAPYPGDHVGGSNQHVQDRDRYLKLNENRILQVADEPVSTFSIDVDTAAYSNVRRMLNREGRLPPEDAVKVEEFINYFDYAYHPPARDQQPFSVHTEIAPSPWNANTHLLKVGLKGYQPDMGERPAANLVFLVDVSGSMRSPHKLGLVKQSLRLLVNQMNSGDRVAIAVYAGSAGLVLDSTPGDQKAKILSAIDALEAGGSTNGGAGIKLAYSIAAQHLVEGGINRVLIASDGDMNVGTVNHEALVDLVERNRERGIALTTLGFGAGNYNYALMEEMADSGNGNAAYIDSLKEAHKVLVKEMGSTLQTIAKDVKIQIEFNPELVSEYRLIGYENRVLNREDFRNDKVDAGEIGVGHTVTALYELALVGSGGEQVEPLRYGGRENEGSYSKRNNNELGELRLRYKSREEAVSKELREVFYRNDVIEELAQSSTDFRFAAAVAGFGQLLRGSKHTGDWDFNDLLQLARGARGDDRHGYRGEMLALVELSRDLSGPILAAHDS